MKDLVGFTVGKLNKKDLKFHYLRVGKAAPLLDKLRETTEEDNIEWVQHETTSFGDYHFGKSYSDYDGAIINLGINEDNLPEMRRDFWENYIWKTKDMPLLVAVIIPDSTTFGSLTGAQIQEGLSLVRLTDRPFKIFENKEGNIDEITEWISSMASIIHRKEREEESENEN